MPLPLPNLVIEQLNMEIAGSCNFQCVTCPQAKINGGREKEFRATKTLEEFRKVVDDAYQYRDPNKTFYVSLHGSGEPTLNRHLPEIIRYAKSKGNTYVSFLTHGNRLSPELSLRVIESGINEVTVSMIGYDREAYNKSMLGGNFEVVMGHVLAFQDILRTGKYPNTKINTRHLVLDSSKKDWEVEQYLKNIINPLGVEAEIWLPHNWAGSYAPIVSRSEMAKQKSLGLKSCGRPRANYLEVRAGGINGHKLAVVACPIVLGRDSQGTLGHLDTQTIAEVVSSSLFENLRRFHDEGLFGGTFCEGCDYLYPDLKEVLAWTNKSGRKVGQSMTATELIYSDAAKS